MRTRHETSTIPEGFSRNWPDWCVVVAEAARVPIHVHELIEVARRAGFTEHKSVNLIAWLENEGLITTTRKNIATLTQRGRRYLDAHVMTAACFCSVCRRQSLAARETRRIVPDPKPPRPRLHYHKGNKNPNRKLSLEAVAQMRALSSEGIRTADLSSRFHVHPATVRRAVTGATWE